MVERPKNWILGLGAFWLPFLGNITESSKSNSNTHILFCKQLIYSAICLQINRQKVHKMNDDTQAHVFDVLPSSKFNVHIQVTLTSKSTDQPSKRPL